MPASYRRRLRGADARARFTGADPAGLEAEAGAIGSEGRRVFAKAGIDRMSIAPDNGLPRNLRHQRRGRNLYLRSVMLSVGTLTVCNSAAEVLAALLGSPLYCAVSEWLPDGERGNCEAAMPAASVTVPICVPPSKKLTDPVGESPVTLAVNFTVAQSSTGFARTIALS